MNTKLNLCLVSFLALTSFVAQPVKADEWNKKTTFEFRGPVEIPGKVLVAGKYVFQLADSDSDRNIVEVFSEDSKGKDTLIATLLAIPESVSETPDEPVIHFDERPAGTPEAIHSWFYPGENTGWAFVYSKEQTVERSSNGTPTQAKVETAAVPNLPPAPPEVQEQEPMPEAVAAVTDEATEEAIDAPDAMPASTALEPAPELDTQSVMTAATLPQTGESSILKLMTGLALLGGGLAIVFASTGKSA